MYVWYLPYTRAIFENFECTTQGSNSPFVVMASRSMQHSTRGHHVILSTAACRKEIVAIAIHTTMSPQENFGLHTCDSHEEAGRGPPADQPDGQRETLLPEGPQNVRQTGVLALFFPDFPRLF